MLKFAIPGSDQPETTTPKTKAPASHFLWIKHPFEYDPGTPLPKNIGVCDEIIESLIEQGKTDIYQIVAAHVNQLAGFKRYEVSAPPKNITIARPVIIGDQTQKVIQLWNEKNRICDIMRLTGLGGSKIRQILKENNAF